MREGGEGGGRVNQGAGLAQPRRRGAGGRNPGLRAGGVGRGGAHRPGGGATDPPAPGLLTEGRGAGERKGGGGVLPAGLRRGGPEGAATSVAQPAQGGRVSVGMATEMVGGGEPLLRPLKWEGAHQWGSEEENEGQGRQRRRKCSVIPYSNFQLL